MPRSWSKPFPKKNQNYPFYVVFIGRVPGIYDNWKDTHKQVHKYSGNKYKGFSSEVQAKAAYAEWLQELKKKDSKPKRLKRHKVRRVISCKKYNDDQPPWDID